MAPTPVDNTANAQPTDQPSQPKFWNTASIVTFGIFGFIGICLIVTIVAFWFHKRAEHKKLPPAKRPQSYHPFRAQSTDKSGLLANAAPSPEEDKSTMFSRTRESSVSLYLDTEVGDRTRKASMETVSLIPLHVTPAEEAHDPMEGATSIGSGVSALSSSSSRYSVDMRGTRGSLALSPIAAEDDGDLGSRRTRPRSTSAASARYYERTPTDPAPVQPIPTIVHTPSQ